MFKDRNSYSFIIFFFLVALTLSSCADKKDTAQPLPGRSPDSADRFIIALLPVQNVFEQKKRYQPLADYLTLALNVNVETKLLDSYDAVYAEMLSNKVDAAFFASLSYVVMSSQIDIEPVARRLKNDGTSTYRGVIFAHKNRGITEDIRTWKNKRIALVHKSTTTGYIFPRYYLYKKGVLHFEDYFRRVIYTGSNDASILSVIAGDADIGCTSDQIFNRLSRENPTIREKLIILAASDPLPTDVLALKSTDELLKKRLREILLNMEKKPEGREVLSKLDALRFIETGKSDFEPVFEMLAVLGLKLETFAVGAIGRQNKSGSFRKEAEY